MKTLLTILLMAGFSYSQNHVEYEKNDFQYGFSLKAKLEFGIKKDVPIWHYRFSANAGIGSQWVFEGLYPTFNTEMQIYNGGLGSRNKKGRNRTTVDAIFALTLTTGFHNNFRKNNDNILEYRNVPLYYFADFVNPALQNPYKNSLSLGTNVIVSSTRELQRVGFLNLHPFEEFQISYYNDGTPFGKLGLGDGKDRYFTGGGVVSVHTKLYTTVNLFEASYHKFTGYTLNAFELSNEMNLSYVYYEDQSQSDFNKSKWSVSAGNVSDGFGLAVSHYNSIKCDGQHLIHWIIYNAFHLVEEKAYYALEPAYYFKTNTVKIN